MRRTVLKGAATIAAVAIVCAGGAPAFAGSANGDCGSYCSNGNSTNGNGSDNGRRTGQPDSVGKADDKSPQGQAPDGHDTNRGYECDSNSGAGQGNPAHSGCAPTEG